MTLRLGRVAEPVVHGGQMEMDFAQPAGMGGLFDMGQAPGQVGQRRVALAEEPGQLCTHHARHPAWDETLVVGQALRLVELTDGVAHPAIALEQRHLVRMPGAQRGNGAHVDRTLPVIEPRVEAPAQLVEIGGALRMTARVGELAHQQQHELRVVGRPPLVHLFQIGQFGALAGFTRVTLMGRGGHQKRRGEQRADGAGGPHQQLTIHVHGGTPVLWLAKSK